MRPQEIYNGLFGEEVARYSAVSNMPERWVLRKVKSFYFHIPGSWNYLCQFDGPVSELVQLPPNTCSVYTNDDKIPLHGRRVDLHFTALQTASANNLQSGPAAGG